MMGEDDDDDDEEVVEVDDDGFLIHFSKKKILQIKMRMMILGIIVMFKTKDLQILLSLYIYICMYVCMYNFIFLNLGKNLKVHELKYYLI
jgi:hypothetical protein